MVRCNPTLTDKTQTVDALLEILEITLNLGNIDSEDIRNIKYEANLRGIEIYED